MRRLEVALAVLVATAGLAVAGPSVGVVVTGDPALQNKVRAQVTAWIQQHGFAVAAKPLSMDALKTLTNCFVIEDMTCARGVVEHQSTADFLVFVRADLVGGKRSKEANLVAYWFLKDRDAVVDKRNCKPCANAVLAKTTTDLVAAIYDETALAKARLKIADPPGLVVMLDGVNVGVTPLEQDVPPGKHDIALVRDDATLGTVSLETKAGDVTDVKVPIKSPAAVATTPPATGPSPVVTSPSTPSVPPSRIIPGLLIVAGIGAVATGAVFVYYGHKNGPDDPLIYPSATKQGAIIAGVGGAVLITGLVLWWHGTAASSQNGPTAALTPGGTIVGWAGHF
ncbi:MAG TPA: PEGA domain-containing protein [Kofleriaceae bacterium]